MHIARTTRRISYLPGVLSFDTEEFVKHVKQKLPVGVFAPNSPKDLIVFQVSETKPTILEVECDEIAWVLFEDSGDARVVHSILRSDAELKKRKAVAIITPENRVVVTTAWNDFFRSRKYEGWEVGRLNDVDTLVTILKSIAKSDVALIIDRKAKHCKTLWSIIKYPILHILGLEYAPIIGTDKTFLVDYLLTIWRKSPEAYRLLREFPNFNLPDQDSLKIVLKEFVEKIDD